MAKDYYLVHHGILGMKWGHRRWQNEDGSLTPEGYRHYGYGANAEYRNKAGMAKTYYKESHDRTAYRREMRAAKKEYKNSDEQRQKRAKHIKTGLAFVGTALAVYGTYKVVNGVIANKNTSKYYDRGKKYIEKAKGARLKYEKYADLSKYYANSSKSRDISKGYKYLDKARKFNKRADKYLARGSKNIEEVQRILRARKR